MKSGMIAADSIFPLLAETKRSECIGFSEQMKKSSVYQELYSVRNIRPAMTWGLGLGLIYSAIDTYLLRGKAPWTFHHRADNLQLKHAADSSKITYPKHDHQITFDLMTSVALTNAHYEENQPCHLKLKNPDLAISVNYQTFASPETRYCPAGVYEIISSEENTPRLQINATNCIQCKACDIKDPLQNIVWTTPEGGDGPQYRMM